MAAEPIGREELVIESFKSLCDTYLFKPIDTEKLLGHMRDLRLV